MKRLLLPSLFLAALWIPQHTSADEYYGHDAARSLISRLAKVRSFPIGHPRVYDLPGYTSYRPRTRRTVSSGSKRISRRRRRRVSDPVARPARRIAVDRKQ